MSTTPPPSDTAPSKKLAPSLARKFALTLIGYLSLSPFVTTLGLWLDFLPRQFPVIQNFYSAPLLSKSVWFAAGVLGVLAIVALLRAPRLAVVACVVFAGAYAFGAIGVWAQVSLGVWMATATIPLAIVAAVNASRSTNPAPAAN